MKRFAALIAYLVILFSEIVFLSLFKEKIESKSCYVCILLHGTLSSDSHLFLPISSAVRKDSPAALVKHVRLVNGGRRLPDFLTRPESLKPRKEHPLWSRR